MGYNFHITRAEHWSENHDYEISAEEWLSLITNDSELLLDKSNGPFFVKWIGKSSYEEPWFDWYEGNIYTKNPDQAIFTKMLSLAKKLNATVQGDDGERYITIDDFPEVTPPVYEKSTKLSWWQSIPLYMHEDFKKNVIMYVLIVTAIIIVNIFDFW